MTAALTGAHASRPMAIDAGAHARPAEIDPGRGPGRARREDGYVHNADLPDDSRVRWSGAARTFVAAMRRSWGARAGPADAAGNRLYFQRFQGARRTLVAPAKSLPGGQFTRQPPPGWPVKWRPGGRVPALLALTCVAVNTLAARICPLLVTRRKRLDRQSGQIPTLRPADEAEWADPARPDATRRVGGSTRSAAGGSARSAAGAARPALPPARLRPHGWAWLGQRHPVHRGSARARLILTAAAIRVRAGRASHGPTWCNPDQPAVYCGQIGQASRRTAGTASAARPEAAMRNAHASIAGVVPTSVATGPAANKPSGASANEPTMS